MDKERHQLGPVNFLERDKELVQKQGLASRHSSELRPEELRLLLIGKTGDGKSATANTILGRKEFKSTLSAKSVTVQCQFGKTERYGRKIVVVDTPGLCDTTFPPDVIKKELIRSVGYSSPGFHAIIFVLAAGRYTEECVKVRDQFFEWFGEDVSKHSLILLTRADDIEEEEREEYLKSVPQGLTEFMESCDDRVMFFNNKASGTEEERQINELIVRIDGIIKDNEGCYFSNIAFRLAKTYERLTSTPVYQWIVKKFQSLGTSDPTKPKKDNHVSGDGDNAETRGVGEMSDEVHEETSESDEILDEKMESFLEEQINESDTDQYTEANQDSKPSAGLGVETKLRDQIKNPGMFEKFMTFFAGAYDKVVKKFMRKREPITYKKY